MTIHFNPRSREGSDTARSGRAAFSRYFNPRSREGSDLRLVADLFCLVAISIHAPVKGATGILSPSAGGEIISIHAPVKGATCSSSRRSSATPAFQPTLP